MTLEKLEKLQEYANTKVKEMIEDRQVDTQMDFDKVIHYFLCPGQVLGYFYYLIRLSVTLTTFWKKTLTFSPKCLSSPHLNSKINGK